MNQIQCKEILPGNICSLSKLIPGKNGRKMIDAKFDKKSGRCYAREYSKRYGLNCTAYEPETTTIL